MAKKYTLPQLKKYDVNQKVIDVLADPESRAILFSTIRKAKQASDLSTSLRIPLSSVYKKLGDLEALHLIKSEKLVVSDQGRRFRVYRSRVSGAEIHIKKPEPVLYLAPN